MKPWATLFRHLRRAATRPWTDECSDGELLDRYLRARDADAFAALLERHGPMVLGVCRRVLGHEADAEDAFQATFLVLVRKAATISPRNMVGNWLYGVAHRTALKARAMNALRRQKEQATAQTVAAGAPEAAVEDVRVLEQALHALPDKYRAPLLLCALEGKTLREAALHLGWPQGTVACRIARGREMLSRRLVRQGVLTLTLTAPLGLATASVSAALRETVLQNLQLLRAGQILPATSATLWAEGVIHSMNTARVLLVSVVSAILLASGITLALLATARPGQPAVPLQAAATAPTQTRETTSAQERTVNEAAWKAQYLPRQRGYHQEYRGKWLAIAGGQLLPMDDRGQPLPASSLAEADAAARKAVPNAKHRYLFQIGTEGDVSHTLGASGESNRLGRAFVPNGVQNFRTDEATGRVWFLVAQQWHEVGVTGAHERAPYVMPQLSAPLAATGRGQKLYLASGIEAIAVLTSQLAAELGLELWEIPGTATLSGEKKPCRRAYVRFRWQEPAIDVALPIVIWDGFVPPKQEQPPTIFIRP